MLKLFSLKVQNCTVGGGISYLLNDGVLGRLNFDRQIKQEYTKFGDSNTALINHHFFINSCGDCL